MSAAAKHIKTTTTKPVAELVGLDPAFGLGYDIDARNGVTPYDLSLGQDWVSKDPVIRFSGTYATRTRTYTASDLNEVGKMAGDNNIAASAQRAYLVQYSKTDFVIVNPMTDVAPVNAAYHNAIIGIYGDLVRKGIEDPENHSTIKQQFDAYGKPNSAGPFDGVIVATQPWIKSVESEFRVPKAIGWTDGYVGINIVGSPKSDVMFHDRFDKGNSANPLDNGSISEKGTNLIGGEGDDFLVAGDPSDNNGIDQLFGGKGRDTFVFGYTRYKDSALPYRDKWDANPLDKGEDSYAIIKDFDQIEDRLQFAMAKESILVEGYGTKGKGAYGVRLRYANGDLFADIPNLSYDDAMVFLNSGKTTYRKDYDLDVQLFQNR